MARPRLACIWIPRFGLRTALRLQRSLLASGATLDTHRIALYRPGTRYQELLECSPPLERAGVLPGLPLREAQARFPDAAFLPCDDALLDALERASEPLLDALDAFSPVVEPPSRAQLGDGRAAVYMDVGGLEPLYGPEPALAARLGEAARGAAGAPAAVGIAGGKLTAWVAASLAAKVEPPLTVVPEGEDALFLAPLPLETIPLPVQARLALQRLGVRTLGAFAALPANSVALRLARYGRRGGSQGGELERDGLRAHRLAQGIDETPLRPRRPQPAASVEIEFEWEESDLDRLTFALKTLADQLEARLESLGTFHADALRVTWRLAKSNKTGETREALLRLAEPAATGAAFAEHLRWHAEGLDRFLVGDEIQEPSPPDAGDDSGLTYERIDNQIAVCGIVVEALGLQLPLGTQLKLLAPAIRYPGAPVSPDSNLDPLTRSRYARRAIARLQARWGVESVRRATLTTERLPERAFRLADPSLGLQLDGVAEGRRSAPAPRAAPSDTFAPLATPPPFWLIDPPEPAAILTPRRGGRRVLSLPRRRFRARIVQSGGPWKLVDPSALADSPPLVRDYYHVQLEDERACLLYWDRAANEWFLQGLFD